MKYKLHVEREIAISHQLKYHLGKCANEHGHNLFIEVDVEANKLIDGGSSDGMVLDFKDIKLLIDSLDHTNLNKTLSKWGACLENQPTAERVGEWIIARIKEHYSTTYFNSIKVRVHEAKGQWAEVEYMC